MVGLLVFFIAVLQISQGTTPTVEEKEVEIKTTSLTPSTTTAERTTTAPSTTLTTTTTVAAATVETTLTPTSTSAIPTSPSTTEETTTEEPVKLTHSTAPSTEPADWETAPENTFVVRDGPKICLLAKFHATFSISYISQRGSQTPVVVKMPQSDIQKGQCGSESQDPILTVLWAEFRYTLYFAKLPYRDKEGEYWGIKTMEFAYDSRLKIFDGAINAGKKIVRSMDKKEGLWLEADINKSYRCPVTEIIFLYNNEKEKKVAVNLTGVHIQAYNVDKGNFLPAQLCEEASVGSHRVKAFRDETAPIAVGSTFAILTLLAVIGFAVYRSVTAKRVDYSTME